MYQPTITASNGAVHCKDEVATMNGVPIQTARPERRSLTRPSVIVHYVHYCARGHIIILNNVSAVGRSVGRLVREPGKLLRTYSSPDRPELIVCFNAINQ
jgi:hypothetical protein